VNRPRPPSRRKSDLIPKLHVGGSTLTGAVSTLLLLTQHDAIFEFDAVSGAVGIIVVGLAGYLPRRYKSFIMATTAVIGALVAFLIGWIFFDSPFDPNIVSFALVSFIVAGSAYILPSRYPDVTVAAEIDEALAADLHRRNRMTP
jgi:hypothetical protein